MIKIALGTAKGLEYLHKNNIIHRDMRPNNILVNHDYEALVRIQIYMLQNQQHIDPFQWPEWLKLGQLV